MTDVAMNKVKEECTDCHGTGLYSGFCEAKGEAVICTGCDGQGWRWLSNSVQHFPLISVQFFPLFRFSENGFCDA